MYTKVALLLIVTVSCAFQLGSAIKCYGCNSIEQEGCKDKFDDDRIGQITDCNACAKLKASCGTTMRYCVLKGDVDDIYKEDKSGKVCYCNDDLCNSGGYIAVSLYALLLSTAAILL